MRIIKEKKPLENWRLEVECTGYGWNQGDKVPCGSILEIDADDLMKRKWYTYPDSSGMNYGFVCPVCECFTEVNEDNLNGHLKKMAKDYK